MTDRYIHTKPAVAAKAGKRTAHAAETAVEIGMSAAKETLTHLVPFRATVYY